VYGPRGTGKDYFLTGGTVANSRTEETMAFRQREPGLIRLAFEALIAQIAINANA